MSLSDRERAEGFLGYCYCGTYGHEQERVEGFLRPVTAVETNETASGPKAF